ncbi:MAG: MazG nucleotide pyrophosphohydrolase domain-containing protein, partial [Pseudomonadota bacterium]
RRIDLGLAPKSVDTSLLSGVPRNLPALVEALKLQAKASTVGFDWNDPQAVLDKVREEASEFAEAAKTNDPAASADELGDLLFTVVNLARHFDIEPEMALRNCNRKFRRRFGHIESLAKKNGREMADMDLDELETMWIEAKQLEKTPDA